MATNALFWMRLASFVWLPGVLWAMARIAAADRLRPLQVAALALACWARLHLRFATQRS